MDNISIARYISDTDQSSEDRISLIEKFANELVEGRSKLLDLVQLLGEYLTREDSKIRARASSCLSETLAALPRDTLTSQHVKVVTGFLSQRIMDDEQGIPETIGGLDAVVDMKGFTITEVDSVLSTLAALPMRRQSQNTRYEVFLVEEKLLKRFKTYLISLDDNKFVKTHISLANGEKDPRNLLKVFDISYQILQDFDISNDYDDMFDITFCYFPITFEAPKDDPYGITSQDLKLALRKCISGSGLFAKDVIPGLIEKLNSTVKTVKEDALNTLISCIENYSDDLVSEVWVSLWDGIKFEVLHGSDEHEVATLSLRVLQEIAFRLSKLESRDSLDKLIDSVKLETEDKLKEPQSKLALPAATLVAGLSESSVVAFEKLSEFAVSLVLKSSIQNPTIEKQKGVLSILSRFIESAGRVPHLDLMQSKLAYYKDDILGIFAKCLMGTTDSELALRKLAVKGLVDFTKSGALNSEEIGLIVQYLNTIILSDASSELTTTCLDALVSIGETNEELIATLTLPALLSQLPEEWNIKKENDVINFSQKSAEYILAALGKVCISRHLFSTLSIRLFNRLDAVSSPGNGNNYSLAIVLTFLSIMETMNENWTFCLSKFIPQLWTKVLTCTEDSPLRSNEVVDVSGKITELVVRSLPDNKQADVLRDAFAIFVDNEPSPLCPSFKPYEEPIVSKSPSNLVSLFTMTIAPVGLNSLFEKRVYELLQIALQALKVTTIVFERSGYLRLIALISNKWQPDSLAVYELANGIDISKGDTNELETYAWITKGLVMKGDRRGFMLADKLVSLLNSTSKQVSTKVAIVLSALIADDAVVSKENNAIIRRLYKQRLFNTNLPKLVTGFKTNTENKVSYMTALAGFLRFTPSMVVVPEIPKFLPLLLESLDLPDVRVQKAVLDTIFVTLAEASDTFSQHLNTLVPKLLALTNHKKVPSASVRCSALMCLTAIAQSLELSLVMPYRSDVINQLVSALDDPKRAVRTEAVKCRQAFFELR